MRRGIRSPWRARGAKPPAKGKAVGEVWFADTAAAAEWRAAWAVENRPTPPMQARLAEDGYRRTRIVSSDGAPPPPPASEFPWHEALGASALPIGVAIWSPRRRLWRVWKRTGAIREVTLRSGLVLRLAEWQSSCFSCGASFETTTPLEPASMMLSEAFSVINCEKHRLPPNGRRWPEISENAVVSAAPKE